MHDRFHDTNMSIFRVTKRNYSHIECYNYDLFAVASTMSILFMKKKCATGRIPNLKTGVYQRKYHCTCIHHAFIYDMLLYYEAYINCVTISIVYIRINSEYSYNIIIALSKTQVLKNESLF